MIAEWYFIFSAFLFQVCTARYYRANSSYRSTVSGNGDGGFIAGIVVGSLVFCGGIASIIIGCCVKKHTPRKTADEKVQQQNGVSNNGFVSTTQQSTFAYSQPMAGQQTFGQQGSAFGQQGSAFGQQGSGFGMQTPGTAEYDTAPSYSMFPEKK